MVKRNDLMNYHKNMKRVKNRRKPSYFYYICTIIFIVICISVATISLILYFRFRSPSPSTLPIKTKTSIVSEFTYPMSANKNLMKPNINACRNFYDRSCGNWNGNSNRLFNNAYLHNKQSMDTINENIRHGNLGMMSLFYKSCRNFVNNPQINSSFIKEMLNEVNSIKSNEDYDKIFGILSSNGIRQPIDVSLREFPYFLKKDRRLIHQFEESGIILQFINDNWNHKYSENIELFKRYVKEIINGEETFEFLNNGLEIHNNLYRAFSDTPKNITDDSQYTNNDFTFDHLSNLFIVSPFSINRFIKYAGIKKINDNEDIYVLSMNFFVHLDWMMNHYNVEVWKDYLKFMIYGSILKKIPILPDGKSDIDFLCIEHTKHYFPISTCKQFVNDVIDHKKIYNESTIITRGVLDTIIENIKNKPDEFCLKNNSDIQKRLINNLDTIEISIGKCFLVDWEQKISHSSPENYKSLLSIEQSYKADLSINHIDNIYKMIHDPMFRLHRAQFIEDYENPFELPRQQRLFDSFSDVNAWYDTVNHRIVIPPGILVPPMIDYRYDQISKSATFGFIIGHEITHSTERLLHRGMSYIQHNKEELQCLNEQFHCLSNEYKSPIGNINRQKNWYGKQTFYENRADAIGLQSIYHLMKHKLLLLNTKEKEKQFFDTVGQTWCSGYDDKEKFKKRIIEDPHAIYRDRVTHPVQQLNSVTKRVFEDIYKCKFENQQCFFK